MIRKKKVLAGCLVTIFLSCIGLYYTRSSRRVVQAVKIVGVKNKTYRHKSKELDEKLPEPFRGRRMNLKKRCRSLFTKSARNIIWDRYPHNQMLIDWDRNMAYCSVEKAGSTIWKSIFAKLSGKLSQNLSVLQDDVRSKDEIHGIFQMKLKNYSRKRATDFLRNARLMLFVRDPYVRLTSAYMDKLFSPNTIFWSSIGSLISSKIKTSPSSLSLVCGHDVTFEEFLRYFILSETKKSISSEHHWTPVWRLCQPCALPYRYIGKVETFHQDAKELIKLLNMDEINFEHDLKRLDAVTRDVAQYVMNLLQHLDQYKSCITVPNALQRLWTVFKYKGYFHENEPFILPNVSRIPVNTETSIIHGFLNMTISKLKETLNLELIDERRFNTTKRMFSHISPQLCADIQRLLYPDVVLFGYNSSLNICPSDLAF